MSDASTTDLLPVRMLNEFAYCPRLFYLMHVEGRKRRTGVGPQPVHVADLLASGLP